jgi:3',5'-cyclic AMP phosphodiesterase CpdA
MLNYYETEAKGKNLEELYPIRKTRDWFSNGTVLVLSSSGLCHSRKSWIM